MVSGSRWMEGARRGILAGAAWLAFPGVARAQGTLTALQTDMDLIALSRRTDHAGLRDMAVFDAVVNNADRKIGHLLPLSDGRLYGCDHGVCFGEEYKLRTVLWQWRGRRLPGRCLQALEYLQEKMAGGDLAAELAVLLSPAEVRVTRDRIDLLIQHRVHPYPPEDWPAVPWPPV